MTYTQTQLKEIFNKSPGSCYICDRQTLLSSHGLKCKSGTWEVDHNIPISREGADAMHNWFPACYPCNREKGDKTKDEFVRWINSKYNSMAQYKNAIWAKYC